MFDFDNIYSEDDLLELKEQGASREELLKAYAMIPQNNRRKERLANQERKQAQEKILAARVFSTMYPKNWEAIYLQDVEELVRKGADIEAKDVFGSTALKNAVQANRPDLVAFFIKKGANVNTQDNSLVTPLMAAADKPDGLAMALQLLKNGAKVDATDVFGYTALSAATTNEMRFLLIKHGAKVNVPSKLVRGQTVLMTVIGGKNQTSNRLTEIMIAKGADVNAQDNNGLTPLHYACGAGKEMTETLLKAKANPNIQNKKGQTPLMYQIRTRSKEEMATLLAHCANVNAKDGFGRTALMYAAQVGLKDKVAFLLEKGANPLFFDRSGHTALSLVTHNKENQPLIKLLEAATKMSYAASQMLVGQFEERSQKASEILEVNNHKLRRALFMGVSHTMPINVNRWQRQRQINYDLLSKERD